MAIPVLTKRAGQIVRVDDNIWPFLSDNIYVCGNFRKQGAMMSILINESVTVETAPSTLPIPVETMPTDPNDPCGVTPALIEEIEEIGRNHPRR
jgi:hypothetical protein